MTSGMKWVVAFIGAVCLAIAYYFAVALPDINRQRLDFEKMKFEEQQKEKKEKETSEALAKFQRDAALEECIESADDAYWSYIKLNDGKEVAGKPGVYTASKASWDEAARRKKAKLDECFSRFR